MLTILVLFVTTVVFFCIYARYKLNYWKRRGVESIPANLIFGNFKDAVLFRSAPGYHLGQLYKMAKSNAPFVGFYIFHKPCLLLRDPEIIKHFMIRDFDNFSDRHFAGSNQKDSIGMKNLFGVKNPVWKYLRTKITPTLTKGKLKQIFPLMIETGQPMMTFLKKQSFDTNNTKIVDAQELSYKYTTDLIASVALGTKMDSFHYPNAEFTAAVAEFFHGFKRMVALVTVFFMPELVELFGTKLLFNSSFVKKVFWEAMENREKSGKARGDFIDSLLQLKYGEQNPDYKFEGDNLLYQSGTFFSGFESSSTCMSFTLMELANHLECQQLAREDINAAIEKYGWTYEAFNNMKYLDQAIAEGLRLHPPVSTIDRYTREDYQIPGTDIIIEKGTPIYISLYGIHDDPRFFDEPHVFNPDRFAKGNEITDAYMPFGIGPRMCIGSKAGTLHAKVVLSMLLSEYEIWQNHEDKSSLDTRSTFTAAADGIKLHFKKIRSRIFCKFLHKSEVSKVQTRSLINIYVVTLINRAMLNVLLIFLAFLATLYLWMKRKHSYWQKRGVRSLPGHWFFGNFKNSLLMRTSPGMMVGNLHKQAADEDDVLGIYIFHKPFLVVRNPELIKQMLVKDFHVFPNHHFSGGSIFDDLGSSSLFSLNNPKWKYLRTKMTPVFTSGKLKNLFMLMMGTSEAMRVHLRDLFKEDSKITSINVKDTFYKYTTNVIASVAFGIQINCFDTQTPEFYTRAIKPFRQTLTRAVRFFFLFFFPNFGKYLGLRILGDSTDYFRKVFWNSMDNRTATKMKRGDLIDSLIQLKSENISNNIFRFDGDALVAQAAIFFVAGRETSITTMTYVLCEMAKNPDMQKRLRQEIIEKIEAANGITYEAVQDMKYLQQVISETLRLYPPASILDRVAVENYTFPGTKITIEKDTPIYIGLYGLHTDPRYHPNPLTFDPERFSDERKNEILPCTYMPFGEGPRNCIGMRLGYLQTAVGVITILRDYEVALNPSWLCTIDESNVFTTPPMGFQLDLKKM
ncbi:uncharacterized protein LOC116842550 [Odontomachus brunneus]|uniref:uncharacterized protein LOC116842550 n=1 Tax=Odontomachus brunneus TaxID=486640 RepID=UPI0013F1B531|nr:uncharacterized protein LOC116842550 [Odontomachus brunneus]